MNPSLLPTAFTVASATVYHGDAIQVMRSLPPQSVDSVVCDPPYAIAPILDAATEFALKSGESVPDRCAQCLVVPPCYGLRVCTACADEHDIAQFATAGMLGQHSQNWHQKATHSRGYADNDPRLFGRWCVLWARECHRVLKPGGHIVAFGGTRTWHRLATAVEDAGFETRDSLAWMYATGFPKSLDVPTAIAAHERRSGAVPPSGDHATAWAGWGTALKPAHEPIVLARKPLERTVAYNTITHGTGGINLDATRLQDGRWPSNVFLDANQAAHLDDITSSLKSRYFWVAKPRRNERISVDGTTHPTPKPLDLMQELVRLVTPSNGICLDPFAGSGTTAEACLLEGRTCIAVERDEQYLTLIRHRLERRTDPLAAASAAHPTELALFDALVND